MRIFISYGWKDALDHALALAELLRQRGHVPRVDRTAFAPGTPFPADIEEAIAGSDVLLALLSLWSVRPGSFCQNEWLHARYKGVPILPVRLANLDPPFLLNHLVTVDAWPDTEAALRELPEKLDQVAVVGPKEPRAQTVDGRERQWWDIPPRLGFDEELSRHGGVLVGREWLFAWLRDWVDDPASRLLLVTAEAGFGKSALAAQMPAKLNVRGVHFCSRSNDNSCSPGAWLGGLVYQLAGQFEPYREEIAGLDEPNFGGEPEALFRSLIADPLRRCRERLHADGIWVFVIDGLDESVAVGGPGLAHLLRDSAARIPEWLRIIATTRPDESLLARFPEDDPGQGVRRHDLAATDEGNRTDLEAYVARRVEVLVAAGLIPDRADTISRIGERSAGNFLFAQKALDALSDPDPRLRLDLDALPRGLPELYCKMFDHRFGDLSRYRGEVRPLLECLVAARGPLPQRLLLAASGLGEYEARDALRVLSQFLNRTEAGYRIFHQSLAEWLRGEGDAVPSEYVVRVPEGQARLAETCWQEFRTGPSAVSAYTRAHLASHLEETGRWDDLVIAAASEELSLLPRWTERGEAEQGIVCLSGLVDRGRRDPVYRAALATQLARIHSRRGEHDLAEKRLQEAARQTSWLRGRRVRAVALHELGSLHLYRKDRREAKRNYRGALRLCAWGWPVYRDEVAANRIGLATVASEEYRWRDVLRLARRAHREATGSGDIRHVLAAERLIAMALDDLGQYEEARAALQSALDESVRLGVAAEETRLLAALGGSHYAQAAFLGHPPSEAERYLLQAVDVARRVHTLYGQLDARMRLGWCALAGSRTDEAVEAFREVAARVPPGSHDELRAGCELGEVAAAHQTGDFGAAEAGYRRALKEAEERDFRGWAATAAAGLGAVCWHQGRREEAEAAWSVAREFARRNSPRAQELTEAALRLCRADPRVPPR